MAEIARKTKRYPSDLTDEEWARIRPLLPKTPRRGRKPAVDLREILNAIRYMARSAGGWRMLPTDSGSSRRSTAPPHAPVDRCKGQRYGA
jgi:putative transposase